MRAMCMVASRRIFYKSLSASLRPIQHKVCQNDSALPLPSQGSFLASLLDRGLTGMRGVLSSAARPSSSGVVVAFGSCVSSDDGRYASGGMKDLDSSIARTQTMACVCWGIVFCHVCMYVCMYVCVPWTEAPQGFRR
jgi:hypothetical protein